MNKKTTISALVVLALVVVIVLLFTKKTKTTNDDSQPIDISKLTCNLQKTLPNMPEPMSDYKVFLKDPSSCDDQNGYKGTGFVIVEKATGSVFAFDDKEASFDYAKPNFYSIETVLDATPSKFIVFDWGTGVVSFRKILSLNSGNSITFKQSDLQGEFISFNEKGEINYEASNDKTERYYIFSEPSEFSHVATDGYMNNISVVDLSNLSKKVLMPAEKNVSYTAWVMLSPKQKFDDKINPKYSKTVYLLKKDGTVDDAPGKEKVTPITKEVVEALKKYANVSR